MKELEVLRMHRLDPSPFLYGKTLSRIQSLEFNRLSKTKLMVGFASLALIISLNVFIGLSSEADQNPMKGFFTIEQSTYYGQE